mmetsp:Transcript_14731/g.62210  ORF Transcript_14731/g.62210 Transcript_14731/m.62210 type:complete len:204 (-) Transcript_14731:19-630(-)
MRLHADHVPPSSMRRHWRTTRRTEPYLAHDAGVLGLAQARVLGHEGEHRAPRRALLVLREDAAHLVVDLVVVLDDAVDESKSHDESEKNVRPVKAGNAVHPAHDGDDGHDDDVDHYRHEPVLPIHALVVLRQGADALLELDELRLADPGFHNRQKLRVVERGLPALVTAVASALKGFTVKVVHDRPDRGRRAAKTLTHPPVTS